MNNPIHFPNVRYKEKEITDGNTYEVYTAPNPSIAIEFLRTSEIKEERKYIIVETPQGNFGKDMIMIFNEKTQERIEFTLRKSLPENQKSKTNCTKCGYPILPITRKISGKITSLEELKENGYGLFCYKCQTSWCSFCLPEAEFYICPICKNHMDLYYEPYRKF